MGKHGNNQVENVPSKWGNLKEETPDMQSLKCLSVTPGEMSVGRWNVLNSAKDTQMHRTQSLPWRSLWSSCEMNLVGENLPCAPLLPFLPKSLKTLFH